METTPASLADSVIGPNEFHLPDVNDHHDNFLECIRTRKTPLAPIEEAHRSATICHIGNIAMKLGRKLRWDPKAEQFLDDARANRLLARPMRSPYTLKEMA
jgi:myo-inositol 2-dehydrogenase / D-chiro-inositol 1-dehydrogenase